MGDLYRKIGFFDSGVGGISVLQEAVRLLPHEDFIYYGDNANAPYGSKCEEKILALTQKAVSKLLTYDIKALVIACNTATSAAAKTLRAQLEIPVIGMEPPLKPAQEHRQNGQIIVLATQATLRQEKFRLLMQRYGEGAVCIPGNGLVELVEQGIFEGVQVDTVLHQILDKPLKKQTDSVALGCTHYPFLRKAMRKIIGKDIEIFDAAGGTTRQLRCVLEAEGLLRTEGNGSVTLLSSSEDAGVQLLMQKLLHHPI